MSITEEKTIADIVAENIKTSHIFKKHGIDFCCGGGITVQKACEKKGLESQKLANSIYPRISGTTDVALDFNDKYAEVNKEDLLEGFDNDLSVIGESLELRFELEDELIDNLFSNHTD